MKPFITCLLILVTALSAEEPAGKANIAVKPVTETKMPTPDELALVKGYIVSGKLTKVIGEFSTYGWPEIGDTFEIDLANLPSEKIQFKRPSRMGDTTYMPFSAPLTIERLRRQQPVTEPGRASINLSARDANQKFLIQVRADRLEDGSKVTIYFSNSGIGTFIGGMAEAEGVLKEKPEPSPITSPLQPDGGNPKTVEEAAQTGAATAAKDIQAGVLRILYFGKPYPPKPLVDEATGYRVQVVGGCIATAQFSAEVKAYNDAMHQWHASQPNKSTPKK